MAVRADRIAYRSAPQPMTRHAVDLAQYVPEGEVDAADRRAADDAVPVPEMLAVHRLPEVLDASRIFAHDQRG